MYALQVARLQETLDGEQASVVCDSPPPYTPYLYSGQRTAKSCPHGSLRLRRKYLAHLPQTASMWVSRFEVWACDLQPLGLRVFPRGELDVRHRRSHRDGGESEAAPER